MKFRQTFGAISFFLFVVVTACDRFHDPGAHYQYKLPALKDELPVSSLQAEGIDGTLIAELTDLIIRERYKRIDGLLIARNNKLVYENYFHGYSEDTPHNIFSAGKSITSILTGIAINKGYIENVNESVVSLLPEYNGFQNPDPRKNAITVLDLLNMTAGLDCEDWYAYTEEQMQQSQDWVKFTMDLPMVYTPGAQGSYCTGCAVTLGRIIENQSHMSLQQFAKEYLFDPLNISGYQWHIMPDGHASGGGLFFMKPRDMVKIGLLMLNDGTYNGTQIVSNAWVTECTQNNVHLASPFDGYGYLWWKQKFSDGSEAYFADGNGGQQIFIIPAKELVIAFTTGNQNTSVGLQNFEIVNKYILPATK